MYGAEDSATLKDWPRLMGRMDGHDKSAGWEWYVDTQIQIMRLGFKALMIVGPPLLALVAYFHTPLVAGVAIKAAMRWNEMELSGTEQRTDAPCLRHW